MPKRRRSEILESFQGYQKEEAEKDEDVVVIEAEDPFSNKALNTPLLQRIAKKLYNDNKSSPKTPKTLGTIKLDLSDRSNISMSDLIPDPRTRAQKTSTPKPPNNTPSSVKRSKNRTFNLSNNDVPSAMVDPSLLMSGSDNSLQLHLSDSDSMSF